MSNRVGLFFAILNLVADGSQLFVDKLELLNQVLVLLVRRVGLFRDRILEDKGDVLMGK